MLCTVGEGQPEGHFCIDFLILEVYFLGGGFVVWVFFFFLGNKFQIDFAILSPPSLYSPFLR